MRRARSWDPWTHEADDGYDTVRWAAALPGSNGRVGMFGQSYFGNTQWMAAVSEPPELKAIAPRDTFSEPDDGLCATPTATSTTDLEVTGRIRAILHAATDAPITDWGGPALRHRHRRRLTEHRRRDRTVGHHPG